ncbi:hypothetical protein PIB30_091649, partial [Stylosanthes scabra]|nr:hypothetical protein [Stylosanthes scabra]
WRRRTNWVARARHQRKTSPLSKEGAGAPFGGGDCPVKAELKRLERASRRYKQCVNRSSGEKVTATRKRR